MAVKVKDTGTQDLETKTSRDTGQKPEKFSCKNAGDLGTIKGEIYFVM